MEKRSFQLEKSDGFGFLQVIFKNFIYDSDKKSSWLHLLLTLAIHLLFQLNVQSKHLDFSNKWYFVTKNVWQLWEKNVLVIEKIFWNSRLKAENLQKLWYHLNNLFKQWKVWTIFGNRMLFTLFQSAPNNFNETYTFMGLGRAGCFRQS